MPGDDMADAVPSAQCSLCGIVLPAGLMVPDGGQACADVRWYCRDAKACTERWTANPPRRAHLPSAASTAAPPREASQEPGEPRPGERPDPAPPKRRGRASQRAWSIDPS